MTSHTGPPRRATTPRNRSTPWSGTTALVVAIGVGVPLAVHAAAEPGAGDTVTAVPAVTGGAPLGDASTVKVAVLSGSEVDAWVGGDAAGSR